VQLVGFCCTNTKQVQNSAKLIKFFRRVSVD